MRKDRLAGEGRQKKNYIRSDRLEITRGGTHKEPFTVKCAFLYNVYGIAKIENYSCNKGECFVFTSHIITLIQPKCAMTREPKDEHCVLQYMW